MTSIPIAAALDGSPCSSHAGPAATGGLTLSAIRAGLAWSKFERRNAGVRFALARPAFGGPRVAPSAMPLDRGKELVTVIARGRDLHASPAATVWVSPPSPAIRAGLAWFESRFSVRVIAESVSSLKLPVGAPRGCRLGFFPIDLRRQSANSAAVKRSTSVPPLASVVPIPKLTDCTSMTAVAPSCWPQSGGQRCVMAAGFTPKTFGA